ncbi:MAG TPA: tRNA (N6-isopentenyl adenosine(37)-C2)-methylthiotransferase MiaB [Pyrinomonadaceae bacterium]|jgi:tRNA-2-methylthio-N6-dimethylallyladenosine synthase|nr:tRNA (N6-isopentenyl adenosine(37)-C2)-methylthiotransferase MiaB [Pyrinomonadaceae bacterium]
MLKGNVYIETFGCQMNIADTERATSRLRAAGYGISAKAETADVILFNTCSVRARAEQKVFNRIGEIRKGQGVSEPIIGIMGCVAQLEGETLFGNGAGVRIVAGTRATDRLPDLIERAFNGEKHVLDLDERLESEQWDVPVVGRHSPYVAYIPIIEGCNKFCTYCIVPFSRGREQSRAAAEIIDEIKRLRDEGYQEIQLLGQNVNSYRPKTEVGLEGFSGATPFSKLLRAAAATEMPRIKFTTSFPRDFHPDIIAAMDEHENLCDWVHLPVQSGSDRILRAMRRGYKVSDYLSRVDTIKNARRRYALTSDIIVGFPGETSEDFEATLRLIEYCRYDALYIFKYSERSGTPSAGLEDDVSDNEKTARFLELEKLQRDIQKKIYAEYVGKDVSVLVERKSAKSDMDMSGHTTCNKVVNFPCEKDLEGKIISIRVNEAKANSLYGELV